MVEGIELNLGNIDIEGADIKKDDENNLNKEEKPIENNKQIDEEITGGDFIEDTKGEINIKETENIIKKRKEKIVGFFKTKNLWVFVLLIIAVILGIYIRSMPMQDHGGNPGLWDITTNTWTLGPDLDPWLFFRYTKIIVEQGSLPKIDMMRNVPLGFDTSIETPLLPLMIAGTYYFLNIFSDASVIYAAAIFPVIMFALTIITFFLFVREIFIRKTKESKTKANIIALISSFFMIVIPAFLSRTIAGIPEKESAAFFFMFLAFYLFLKAWKSEKLKKAVIFAVSAGIATVLMRLIWGGVLYIFLTIGIASFAAFILNKVHKKEFIVYSSWLFVSLISTFVFLSNKISLTGLFLTGFETTMCFFVFLIFLIHFILWKTKLSEMKILTKYKLPKNIISIIIALIFILISILVFLGPGFLIDRIKMIHQMIFKPTYGRWSTTVAESRQPFFTEWGASFGPFIKNIPVFFWLFFIGSVVLFKKMLNKIKQKDSWILTGAYLLFLIGIIFSRYSGSSIFNGSSFISKSFYYISALILISSLGYYYIKYCKKEDKGFEKIDYELLILFALFIFGLFGARSAIRLILVLAPITTIFVGYLIVESVLEFRKADGEIKKIILGVLIILILLSSIFVFWTFYKSVKSQAYNTVPSSYNQQWQKAMKWVREETPKDAVFGHWWDYGYWLQSIGERATVLDGGNAISFWNYYMGRLVLTGDNQDDALEFLYNHDTTHLLIDSSDIGKYGAYSSIGSDENYDRASGIGTFILNEKQTQETQDKIMLVYSGGVGLDEDLVINENGKEILLPAGNSGVGAIVLPIENIENSNDVSKAGQPYIIIVYQGLQHKVNLRYLYGGGEFVDFGSGIESCAYVFPRLIYNAQGLSSYPIGAAMFISPRLMRGMFSQVYLLDDSLNNFPNFKLIHSEPNFIVNDLRNQGMNLPEIIYYSGIQGPIKIWKIEYTGNEQIKEEYLDRDASKYLNWTL